MTTWMDLEGIMLSAVSKKEKDKYCMISLKCDTNKKKTQAHRYKEQIAGFQRW